MLQKLKAEFKQRIKDDEVLQVLIAQAFGKKMITVRRWNDADDVILTTKTALDIIRDHMKLAADVEMTEENETLAATG